MAARSVLDADMATVFGWLRSGFGWWVEELRAMVPKSLQPKNIRLSTFVTAGADGNLAYCAGGESVPLSEASIKPGDVAVVVDPALVLIRSLALPALPAPDIRKLVYFDADRLFPLPASAMLLAIDSRRGGGPDGINGHVRIACLPIEQARRIMAGLADKGLALDKLILSRPEAVRDADIDFTPALVDAGLIKRRISAAFAWWMLAAFLFAMNIGLLVVRDVQLTQQLALLVESQQPAVQAARSIARRISNNQALASQVANRRVQQDGVAALATITAAMPAQAWVQRYAWDGQTIRLTGYKREGVDVLGALRKSPLLANVRSTNADAIAELPTGQPFDLTAEVRLGGAG